MTSSPEMSAGRLKSRAGKIAPEPEDKPGVKPAIAVHAAESGGVATAAGTRPVTTSLAALLTRHILRDGELVILILKPSLWFIVIVSMRFAAVVLIGIIAAKLWMPQAALRAAEVGIFLISSRVMVSILQWMGRLYVLTDFRILRLSGVFTVDIFDCPLRKIGQTRLYRNFRERLLRLGSIEILPSGEDMAPADWRTIKHPADVLETIDATVRRAKQGGGNGGR